MVEKKEGRITVKIPKINIWIPISLVLAIVLILSLLQGWSVSGRNAGVVNSLTAEQAANKAINWISSYYKSTGVNVTITLLNASKTENGVYGFTIKLSGAQGSAEETYYASEDGKLFFPQGISTDQVIQQTAQSSGEIPKTDKPTVELFVMSFCPYGIQAENAMKPVVDLLGDKVTIETHYIVSVSGTTASSLHGDYEATEDMRQACIWKYYDQSTFWNYVSYLNSNCNKNNIDACWKDAAKNATIDTVKIGTCVTNDGLTLMKTEEALSSQNGVTGSPTLIINGVTYSGDRTSESYKQAICSGFTTQPSECSQTLSTAGSSTASGGCQ